ncbi:MAG: GntR family transcriptional regulator [Acetobacteraceae bacterium]
MSRYDQAAQAPHPVPLYEHVKRQLSEAILRGQYPPGAQLPGEIMLARNYRVAVGTVRRALTELAGEGMLARRRKTGTVVTGRPPHHSLRFFFQYFRLRGADGALLRSEPKVLRLNRIPADAESARQLALSPGANLIAIDRLRSLSGRPVMRDRFLLPAARLPDFPERPADVPDLIYLHLVERYGIRISAVRERLTAALATAEDRRLLALPARAALLHIDEIAYDQGGQPMILAHHRAATDSVCYINEVR